jgi:uncharacterized protein YraI
MSIKKTRANLTGRIAGAAVAAGLALTAPAIATAIAAPASAEGGDFNLDFGDPATVVLPTELKSGPGLFAPRVAFLRVGSPINISHECNKVTWCRAFNKQGAGWVWGGAVIRN